MKEHAAGNGGTAVPTDVHTAALTDVTTVLLVNFVPDSNDTSSLTAS